MKTVSPSQEKRADGGHPSRGVRISVSKGFATQRWALAYLGTERWRGIDGSNRTEGEGHVPHTCTCAASVAEKHLSRGTVHHVSQSLCVIESSVATAGAPPLGYVRRVRQVAGGIRRRGRSCGLCRRQMDVRHAPFRRHLPLRSAGLGCEGESGSGRGKGGRQPALDASGDRIVGGGIGDGADRAAREVRSSTLLRSHASKRVPRLPRLCLPSA